MGRETKKIESPRRGWLPVEVAEAVHLENGQGYGRVPRELGGGKEGRVNGVGAIVFIAVGGVGIVCAGCESSSRGIFLEEGGN